MVILRFQVNIDESHINGFTIIELEFFIDCELICVYLFTCVCECVMYTYNNVHILLDYIVWSRLSFLYIAGCAGT